MNKKSIILLSGGLDSAVSLAKSIKKYNIDLAITFDYGQKAKKEEINSSAKICRYYGIKHKIIKLNLLKEISNSSLTTNKPIPEIRKEELDIKEITQNTAKAVWVPNRNGLFINIAASFAEALGYTHIIIGANKEEGKTFKDNSKEFISAVNKSLKNSTNKNIQVKAPLIKYDKSEIIKEGIKYKIPFKYIYSCYGSGNKHCGKCESCLRLKRALELSNKKDIIKELF